MAAAASWLDPASILPSPSVKRADRASPPCCRIRRVCCRGFQGARTHDLVLTAPRPVHSLGREPRGRALPHMNVCRTPSKVRRAGPACRAVALATAVAVAAGSLPARAQTGANAGIPLIRDAEIEQLLRDYTKPILRVAGLSNQNIHVVIINSRAFNEFVMDAHRIFVNAGALMDAKTPNEIIGVFAHETGHIVGGHLSKRRQELATAQTAAIIAMLLGAGAVVAGARSGNANMGDAGMAVFSAPQSYILHSLLAYQRAQEDYADRAGVRFLTMTGQSAKGMYDTFKRFADETMFEAKYVDPYAQNHPMPQSNSQHSLLAYQRAQEDYADRAGVRFLTMTGQSA